MSQAELAAYVVSQLDKAGIEVVLSGGAAVSVYKDNQYQSRDIDLIETGLSTHNQIQHAMRSLGFQGTGRHFEHPDSTWLVEFPGGPPYVGGEPVGQVEELTFATGKLRLISATDSVKDRLSAYFHWHDRHPLQQARLIAERQHIDVKELKRWSAKEGKEHEFEEILPDLSKD